MKKIFCLFSVLFFAVFLFGCPEDSEDSNNSDKNKADLNQLNDFNVFDENVFDLNAVDENVNDSNACVEDWECSEFSECINREKTRDCWDNNECGLVNNLTEIRVCDENISDLNAVDQNIIDANALDENRFDENGNCIENWECEEWSECSNGWEKRICIDLHECDSEELRPRLYEHCGECIHEEVVDCVTDENCSGIQECISGEWGDCIDNSEDNCPGECKNGYERICINYQNCPGTQVCSDHKWKTCNDNPYDNCPGGCTSGETKDCTTTEECPGTQTCINGLWNSYCVDNSYDDCPLLCEEQNKTEIELKQENLYYKDESAVQHVLPFYDVSAVMADDSVNTIVIDGQTIWYQINILDTNEDSNSVTFNRQITFRKNNSSGPTIRFVSYIDEDYSTEIAFVGANEKTHKYHLMVDEIGLSARVWLFLNGGGNQNQQITVQYNRHILLYGTRTSGNSAPQYYFYLPHNQYLPVQMGGGTEYNSNEHFVAMFFIDEDNFESYPNSINEIDVFIDTGTGNVIDLPNNELESYSCEVRCKYCTSDDRGGCLIEDPNLGHPTTPYIYTFYGSHIEINNHQFKITIPENSCS